MTTAHTQFEPNLNNNSNYYTIHIQNDNNPVKEVKHAQNTSTDSFEYKCTHTF